MLGERMCWKLVNVPVFIEALTRYFICSNQYKFGIVHKMGHCIVSLLLRLTSKKKYQLIASTKNSEISFLTNLLNSYVVDTILKLVVRSTNMTKRQRKIMATIATIKMKIVVQMNYLNLSTNNKKS